jgi:hypothetical protein
MSVQPPKITNAKLQMTLNEPNISPLSISENLVFPMNFGSLTILKKFIGTYTPNNDAYDLYNFATSPYLDAATWFLLLVDQPVALRVALWPSFERAVDGLSVARIFLWTGPVSNTNPLRSITLDGTVDSQMTPTQQNVLINWEPIMGNGLVS